MHTYRCKQAYEHTHQTHAKAYIYVNIHDVFSKVVFLKHCSTPHTMFVTCICFYVEACTQVYRCLQKPEENVRSPGAEFAVCTYHGCCEQNSGSFGRAASILSHRAIFPVPCFFPTHPYSSTVLQFESNDDLFL